MSNGNKRPNLSNFFHWLHHSSANFHGKSFSQHPCALSSCFCCSFSQFNFIASPQPSPFFSVLLALPPLLITHCFKMINDPNEPLSYITGWDRQTKRRRSVRFSYPQATGGRKRNIYAKTTHALKMSMQHDSVMCADRDRENMLKGFCA